MTAIAALLSTQGEMMRVLGLMLGASRRRPLALLRRTALNEGTFAAEVVECRLGRGRLFRVFCKHGPPGEHCAHGHRGGLIYESEVYQYLSRHSQLPLVGFRGSYCDEDSGYCWLLLNHLQGCDQIHRTTDPQTAMARAAAWAGRFHAEQQSSLCHTVPGTLKRYDRDYYMGWAHRTHRFARPLRSDFPWLDRLSKAYERMIDGLLQLPATVVHGEFYPKNILLQEGTIRPVDWESAAVGAGEIDLATLTEGWTRQVVRRCELEYRKARWPEGAPANFERRLAVCRLYMHLRWLGDRADWTLHKSSLWHFRQLHKIGRQLGVLE